MHDDAIADLPIHAGLEGRIVDSIAPTLIELGYELVRVAVLGRERPTVQIMVDRADGVAVGVEDCETISRGVGAVLDVADLIPGTWTLEVSSPGIDRPLTRLKDWNRFAGHLARAEMSVPLDGRKRLSGVILGADAVHARMRLDDGAEVALPLADLRRAKLVLTDALIAFTATPPSPTERLRPWILRSPAPNSCWSPTRLRARNRSSARKFSRPWSRPSRRPAAPSTAMRRISARRSTGATAM